MDTNRQRTRYTFLAGVASLIAPGLGHLYVGRIQRFILPAVGFLLVALLLGLCGVLSSFYGILTYLCLYLLLLVYSIIDSSVIAHRVGIFTPKWYCRWYLYLVWIVSFFALSVISMYVRGPLLGFNAFHLQTASMTPTIEPYDCVLVDTRAFRNASPKIGDVVAVYIPELRREYIRRVSELPTPSTVSLVSDNPSIDDPTSDLRGIPLINVDGRVTYVFYSPTYSRIGHKIQ